MTERPRLYYGREAPPRRDRGGRLPLALAFPGPERLALSTLGWQAVYRLLAERPAFAIERFFLDDAPAAAPRSADGGGLLSEFPVMAVSLNFEEEHRSFLAALLAAGIAPQRAQRPGWPLIMAGGPLAWLNPAPIAPAVDLFFAGEAEAGLADLLSGLAAHWLSGGDKASFLAASAALPGVYVPGLSPTPVRRVAVADSSRLLADPAWSCFVSPAAEFRDMLLLEVNRGCPYGCRFCAAGYIYRPPRQADEDELKAIVEQANPRKVGLVGTALTDWPRLRPFLDWLHDRGVKFSLSSLRADGLTEEFLTFLRRTGLRTVTLALEAPSQRLRRAANKRLRPDDFLTAVENCARLQINHLKVYLIIGWPGETDADYAELGEFLQQIDAARKRGQGKRAKGLELITLSMGPLVPKPWTPMQWAAMASEAALEARIRQVKELVRPYRGIKAEADGVFPARLQGYLSRAGADAFPFLLSAARLGGWRRAMKELRVDFGPVLDRERGEGEAFPWEVVDAGVGRAFLWREWERYREAAITPLCPAEGCGRCAGCGASVSPTGG